MTEGSIPDEPRYDHRLLVVENIFEAIRDGVMVIDHRGNIVFTNPALTEILGLEYEQLMGKGWAELFLADAANLEFSETVVEVIQNRKTHYNREVCYTAPDGAFRELIATTSLIEDSDGETVGVVAVFKNITELKGMHRRERELLSRSRRIFEEKNESLDRLARAVAHEVRNPVTAIGGLSERLLKESDPASKQAQYLSRITSGARSLEKIVSEVRRYADSPTPKPRRLRLDQWLRQTAEQCLERVKSQKVELVLVEEEQAEAWLDPDLLGKALRILMDNALDAMPDGGVLKLSVSQEGDGASITVQDTGRGITASEMPYLFDPFYTTKADAVGMSLAIAKRIVDEHGGTISVESEYGAGASFIITLPPRLEDLPGEGQPARDSKNYSK